MASYLNPNNDDARQDTWSPDEILWASYQNLLDENLPPNIDYFLYYMNKFIQSEQYYN
jgi:hypothetical protein